MANITIDYSKLTPYSKNQTKNATLDFMLTATSTVTLTFEELTNVKGITGFKMSTVSDGTYRCHLKSFSISGNTVTFEGVDTWERTGYTHSFSVTAIGE